MSAASRGLQRLRPALPVVLLAALLALLPFPTCVLRFVAGIPCPACGLTRATLALARFDVATAMQWHPLAPALFVVAIVTAGGAFVTNDRHWRSLVVWTTGAAGVALVLVWALRFLGCFGGPVPG